MPAARRVPELEVSDAGAFCPPDACVAALRSEVPRVSPPAASRVERSLPIPARGSTASLLRSPPASPPRETRAAALRSAPSSEASRARVLPSRLSTPETCGAVPTQLQVGMGREGAASWASRSRPRSTPSNGVVGTPAGTTGRRPTAGRAEGAVRGRDSIGSPLKQRGCQPACRQPRAPFLSQVGRNCPHGRKEVPPPRTRVPYFSRTSQRPSG